jgi:hypothetical protein
MTSTEAQARAMGTIERALHVLSEAAVNREKVQTRGVALALWVLRGRCPDEWLISFWEAAAFEHISDRNGDATLTNGMDQSYQTLRLIETVS